MDADSMTILILLGSFFLMVFLCFLTAYAVALSSVFCLLCQGYDLTTICQQIVEGIGSFNLMAIPFFITMGCLMGPGRIFEGLIALANACVGQMRGSMAVVNIATSYLFGGIFGSIAVDTASLDSILIPMIVDRRYDDDSSTVVTITSSCEGLLVPPSHNTTIYTATAGSISVGSLSLAGYIPGALLAVSLMIGSYVISVRRNYSKEEKFSTISPIEQLGISLRTLAAVLIIVFGVVGGVFTATEPTAVTIIYSLIVSIFVYGGLNWKDVWRVFGDCVGTLSTVMILIATPSVFGFCLTQLHAPILTASAITGVTNNPIILALLLNPILLVLGCIMDMTPIILITTSILLPTATSIDLDPTRFSIMVVFSCSIGPPTPPVGAVLFIGSTVAKVPIKYVVKTTLSFYLCMVITLLLITFVPAVSMWLPNILGGLAK